MAKPRFQYAMDKNTSSFAVGLYWLMQEMGIQSLYELEEKTQVGFDTLYSFYLPNYKGPSMKILERLAEGLGFSPGEFLNKIEKLYKTKKNKKIT